MKGSLRRSFYYVIFEERKESDGREKAEAYGAEEAGRQSGKKKTEYEGAGACKGDARLSEVAAS